MQQDEIDRLAKVIWDYHLLHQEIKPADLVFVLGSHDIRVAERAVELYHSDYGKWLLFSGGLGRLTKSSFSKTEAELFATIARDNNVPEDIILIENKSTNTSENILLSRKLLLENNINPKSIIMVQKPYMEKRRTYATFMKRWPKPYPEVSITSPQLSYEAYCTDDYPKEMVINMLVGDLQRIIEYPKLGFQIKQTVPKRVLEAFKELCELGYDEQLIKE